MTDLKPEIGLQGPWSMDEIASFFCSVRAPMRLAANGEDFLKQLLGRFARAAQDECAIRIRRSRLTSWDFGRRMVE